MSITFIHDFQTEIYNTLSKDQDLIALIDKVYIGVQKDAATPFISIIINNAKDNSLHNEAIYSIEFQIHAYAKDINHNSLSKISDQIVVALSNIKKSFRGYMICGIKANNVEFIKARDLVHNQMIINYKALIRKRGV